MKKLIFLLLFIISAQAQWAGYSHYSNYLPGGSNKWDKTMSNDAYTVGHWVFDSTYAADKSDGDVRGDLANSHDLTAGAGFDYLNQFTCTSPVYEGGNSLEFDGVDDYFYIPAVDANDVNPGTSDFTIEINFRTGSDVLTTQYLIAKGYSGNHWRIYITGASIYIRVYASGAYWVSFDEVVTANTWYYLALSVDRNGKQVFYSNGIQVGTQTSTDESDISNSSIFSIASYGAAGFMDCDIAEVRYSSKARTYSEIATYYHQFDPSIDISGPTITSYTATGVQYDSVQHVGTFTAESGAYYDLFESQDTTATSLLGGWQALADFNTTLLYNVGQDTTATFYLAAKDSLDNVSWASDAATIEDTPPLPDTSPPNAGSVIASLRSVWDLNLAVTWSDSADADSAQIWGTDTDNPLDSTLLATRTSTGNVTVDIPTGLLYAGNDSLYTWAYWWDEADNRSAKSAIDTMGGYAVLTMVTDSTGYSDMTKARIFVDTDSTLSGSDSSITYWKEDIGTSADSLLYYLPDSVMGANDTVYFATRIDSAGTWSSAISSWYQYPQPSPVSSSWTVDDDFSTNTASNYTAISGGITVSGGIAYGSNTWAVNWVYHNTSLGSANQIVEAQIRSVGAYVNGIVVRCNGTTGYFITLSSTNDRVYLYSFNGSTTTEITNTTSVSAITDDAEHWMRVEIVGTAIDVYVDINDDLDYLDANEHVASWTDATYSAGNYCGVYLRLDAAQPPYVTYLKGVAN